MCLYRLAAQPPGGRGHGACAAAAAGAFAGGCVPWRHPPGEYPGVTPRSVPWRHPPGQYPGVTHQVSTLESPTRSILHCTLYLTSQSFIAIFSTVLYGAALSSQHLTAPFLRVIPTSQLILQLLLLTLRSLLLFLMTPLLLLRLLLPLLRPSPLLLLL